MRDADQVVLVMGRGKAEDFVPQPGDVAISITSPGESEARLSFDFTAIHRVAFGDAGNGVREWGREIDGSITGEQAEALAAFVERHREAPRFLVHCGMGVSRSVAIGNAIANALRIDLECERTDILNMHVYHHVGNALMRRLRPERAARRA